MVAPPWLQLAIQTFTYFVTAPVLFFTLLLVKSQTSASLIVRIIILSTSSVGPPLLCPNLEDKLFVLFNFFSSVFPPLHWPGRTVSFHALYIHVCPNNSFIASLSLQATWVIVIVAIIGLLLLEITLYSIVTLRSSDLGYFGLLHQIIWVIPDKFVLAIEILAEKIRTAAAVAAVAGVGLAAPLGVVSDAIVRGMVLVAAGVVQGGGEVAHGVAKVMAACRGNAATEGGTEESSPPPPYFVCPSLHFFYSPLRPYHVAGYGH